MHRNSNHSNQPDRQLRRAILRGFRRPPAPESAATRTVGPDPLLAEGEPNQINQRRAHRHALRESLPLYLAWAALLFFVLAVVRRGWICDDAFITMRAVDHLIDGRGFVYNAGERVLGFTNPLWALLLTIPYLFIRDPYWAPIVGSVVVSAIAGGLIAMRSSGDRRVGALVLVALCFSRCFVDFSSSGLENPLTHLLLVLFYLEFHRREQTSVLHLSLYAALLLVNRFDALPLLLPPLVLVYKQRTLRLDRRAIALGWSPAIAWFLFALVYYGFPLPNTAYAKLNVVIPKREMVVQGLSYLVDALVNDPQTIILIAAAMLVLTMQAKRDSAAKVALLALVLELVYVVAIGGDFMSGRFLTPAVVVSAAVLAQHAGTWLVEAGQLRMATLGVGVIAASLAFSPFRDDPLREKRDFPVTRIVNERAWFQEHLGILVNLRPVQWKTYGLYGDGRAAREKHRRVVLYNNVGMFAWGAGPSIHVVDDMALTDPLLARIPFLYREDWRTGHLPRVIPDGYLDTLEYGRNVIRDPCIANYFEQLNHIVRGPLFTAERWAAIFSLNLPGGMTVTPCPERIQAPPPGQASPQSATTPVTP